MAYKNKEDQAACSRRHYEANKQKIIQRAAERNKRQRQINKDYIYEVKQNSPCVDCGETNPLVLDFDHVRGEKKKAVSDLAHACCAIKTLEEEIAKCEVRCANCHRIVTYTRKYDRKD